MKPTRCLLCMGGEPFAYHTICAPGDLSIHIEIPACEYCHADLVRNDWFCILTRMLASDAARSTWRGRDQTDALIADKYRLTKDIRERYLQKWKLVGAE